MALGRAAAFGLAFVVAKGDPSCDAAQLFQSSAHVQPAAELNVGTTETLSRSDLFRTVEQRICPVAEQALGRSVRPEEVLYTMDQINAQKAQPMDFEDPEPSFSPTRSMDADKDFEFLQARFKAFLQEGEIVPPRAKAMSLLETMSEKHEEYTYSGWQEDVHEAMVQAREWLRQPEVTEQFLGFLPTLRSLLQKPEFTKASQGATSLLETGSEATTPARVVSSVANSIQKMAAVVNKTMQPVSPQGVGYPFKDKIDPYAMPDPLKPLKQIASDVIDHIDPLVGYTMTSKQFASFDWGLHPVDGEGFQLDFTYMFENTFGPHSLFKKKFGFTKKDYIGIIPGIQLTWRGSSGKGYGAKVEMFTKYFPKKKMVTVDFAGISAVFQAKPAPIVSTEFTDYAAIGKIKWGGGPVLSLKRFTYDFLPKAVTPISLEHDTMWTASKAADTWLLRFTETLQNPIYTAGMQLFAWDVQPYTKEDPETIVRMHFNLPPPKRGSPVW